MLRSRDEDAASLILQLTQVPVEEVDALVQQHAAAPEQRQLQRRLAGACWSGALPHAGRALTRARRGCRGGDAECAR